MTIHAASLINPADDYNFITDRIAIGSVASRVTPGFVAIVSILSGDPYDEKYGAPKPPQPLHRSSGCAAAGDDP